jgi:hypothetical protein
VLIGPKEITEANVVVVENSRIAQTEKSLDLDLFVRSPTSICSNFYLNRSTKNDNVQENFGNLEGSSTPPKEMLRKANLHPKEMGP